MPEYQMYLVETANRIEVVAEGQTIKAVRYNDDDNFTGYFSARNQLLAEFGELEVIEGGWIGSQLYEQYAGDSTAYQADREAANKKRDEDLWSKSLALAAAKGHPVVHETWSCGTGKQNHVLQRGCAVCPDGTRVDITHHIHKGWFCAHPPEAWAKWFKKPLLSRVLNKGETPKPMLKR